MQYHPDLNPDDEKAAQKFMEIKESYKELINDEKRKAYNDKIGFYHRCIDAANDNVFLYCGFF